MTRKDWSDLGKGMAFLAPWLAGFLVFLALPMALSLYYSLCDYAVTRSDAPVVFRGLNNYHELMGDPLFWRALANTLYYAAMALPAGMLVSLGMALLLNMRIKGQGLYRTIVFLPSLAPVVVSAMIWLWLFNTHDGLINHVLRLAHLPAPAWLADERWAMPALALMSLWGVGHTAVIYLAGLQDVPRELYEAADIDGASAWQRLRHVTLPMISPVIFFNLVIAVIGVLQVFAIPQIMTGGGPKHATYFYVMYLYDNAFSYMRMGYASAMAWILLLLILALTALAFWSSKKWVHYQGK
jgi:multiple sugar transport system permease protein